MVPQFLDHGIVGILVGDVECAVDGATVGVLVSLGKQLVLVETPVLIIDSVIKSDDDHLRHISGKKTSGNQSPVT